jgi:hypothetical protein
MEEEEAAAAAATPMVLEESDLPAFLVQTQSKCKAKESY